MKDTKIKAILTLQANKGPLVSEVSWWMNELLKREICVKTQDYDLWAAW